MTMQVQAEEVYSTNLNNVKKLYTPLPMQYNQASMHAFGVPLAVHMLCFPTVYTNTMSVHCEFCKTM